MSSEIAALGIAVDSRQVTTATAELDKFAAASKPAAAGATHLERAAKLAAASASGITKQTGLARHEMVNFGRQMQDVGVSLASGQSPLMVAVQQGTQIADIFASSSGSARGFMGQIAAMVTPMRALALGTAGLGAGAYFAFSNWKTFALQLDDTAKIANTTTQQMSALQSVAAFKGIGQDDFAEGMKRFSLNVYQARNNMGGLADVLRANGMRAGEFTETLGRAADLIKNARDDQQRIVLLQQMGLPATMEWVRYLSQGSDGLKKAADQAVTLGGALNDQMVKKAREADEAWNRFWTNFGTGAKTAVVGTVGYLDQLLNKAEEFRRNGGLIGAVLRGGGALPPIRPSEPFVDRSPLTLSGVRGAVGLSALEQAATVDKDKQRHDLATEQSFIGVFGSLSPVRIPAKDGNDAEGHDLNLRSAPQPEKKGADRDGHQHRCAA